MASSNKRRSTKAKPKNAARAKPIARRTAKKEMPERASIRYAFYILLLGSIISIFFFPYLYAEGIIGINAANADSSIGLSFFFPLVVFAYLMAKGKNLKQIIIDLGLSRLLNPGAVCKTRTLSKPFRAFLSLLFFLQLA